MNIFHSASLKLTLYYLTLIMVLSIGFSLAIYHISSDQLTRGLPRPGVYLRFLQQREGDNINDFLRLRQAQVDDALDRLRANLVVFNLATLAIGGGISYLFARRTLIPIENALETQSRFTADASHELRTPLAAMQTEIDVALRNKKLTVTEARELLGSNLEEVAKLKNLSDALLRLARDNGESIEKKSVELNQVVVDTMARLQSIADAQKITLKSDLKPVKVLGDVTSLQELVMILLDNAIKYSSPQSEVLVTTKQRDHRAIVEVIDHGEGIAAEKIAKIFDRFYRVDDARTKNQAAGHGLGLAIAKKIVDLHHGSIEVKSKPKAGTTFIISLPTK